MILSLILIISPALKEKIDRVSSDFRNIEFLR